MSTTTTVATPNQTSEVTTGFKSMFNHSLSKEQEQEIATMFQMYSKDNKILLKDMHSFIRSNIGLQISMEELVDAIQLVSPETLVEAFSSEGTERKVENVKVDFNTFIQIINARFIDETKVTPEELTDMYNTEIFNLLDANRSGTVGRAELSHYFSRVLGENLVEDQILDMLSLAKNQQTFDLAEFKEFVKQFNLK